jgi:hypothetical protein
MSSSISSTTKPAPVQPTLRTVLRPKWQATFARLREQKSEGTGKVVLLVLLGLGFWSAVFGVFYRVLRYIHSEQEIGTILAAKLLGVTLLAFASLLLLSNLITALSSYFLARDLDMLVAAPVDWLRLYLAKLGETLVHSSWMVVLMAVPIFTAYGIVYRGGPLFPIVVLVALVPYFLLPCVVGTGVTLILVNVFPARRARDLLSLVAIGAAGGLVLLLRLVRPEQLARPEGMNNLLDYLGALRTPTSPFLPSEWATATIMNWLPGWPTRFRSSCCGPRRRRSWCSEPSCTGNCIPTVSRRRRRVRSGSCAGDGGRVCCIRSQERCRRPAGNSF